MHTSGRSRSLAGVEPVADLVVGHVARRGLRPPDGDRPVDDVERVAQHLSELLVRRRREDRHARHLRQQRHVEHAVMRRSVVAGDAGAVEAEDDRLAVQADVVHHLVDGTREERRVHARRPGAGRPSPCPPRTVTACCSAMPTSISRPGKRSPNGSSPVESGIAAVMATSSGCSSPALISASVNAAVYEPGFASPGPCRAGA